MNIEKIKSIPSPIWHEIASKLSLPYPHTLKDKVKVMNKWLNRKD